jgi:hypothetical protein
MIFNSNKLFQGSVLALFLGSLALNACGGKSSKKPQAAAPAPIKKEEQKPSTEKVERKVLAPQPQEATQQGKDLPAHAALYMAEYRLDSISCKSGALSEIAKLENELLSDSGKEFSVEIPNLTNGLQEVTVHRSFEWRFQKTLAVRRTLFTVQRGDQVARFTVDKNYEIKESTDKSLYLVHGQNEKPTANEIDVAPLLALMQSEISKAQTNSRLPENINNWMQKAIKWVQDTALAAQNNPVVKTVVNHLQEVASAQEKVVFEAKEGQLIFSDTKLNIPSLFLVNIENIYDTTMCGKDGKALRNFTFLKKLE